MISVKKRNIIIVALLLILVTVFLGVSTAVFFYLGRGTTNNVIETGRIIFSYSETEFGVDGDNIDIMDALPTPDSVGKIMADTHEYFDFNVSASTTSTDIAYEIVAKKQDGSTMPEDIVKIYLTEFNGATEVETPITGGSITPTFDTLDDTTNNLVEGKTIYQGIVKAGEVAYGKKFRLRMWISDEADAANIADLKFTIKVNVVAVGNN